MTREEQISQAAAHYAAKEYRTMAQEDKDLAIKDFIAGAEWADVYPPSPWISVEDRLPDRDYPDRCLIVRNNIGIYGACGYEVSRGFFFYGTMHYRYTPEITHWMPIPELKGDEQ